MAISNISLEATGQIVTKLYVEPSRADGTKTCPNGPGHMSNMATMPVDSKNFKISSSLEPVDRWP